MRGFELVENKYRVHPDTDIIMPIRGTERSAGYDIVTPVDIVIPARGVSPMVFTDIKSYMLDDEVLSIHIRSSIGIKRGLILANTTGIIDSDYYSNPDNDGNIGFRLRNCTDNEITIQAGERVVQGIFQKYLITDDDKPKNKKRIGGVGSTGKH